MQPLTQEQIDERLAQTPLERRTDEQTAAERRAICNNCEKKTNVLGVDQCSSCGCILLFKAAFKGSRCPLNKWQTQ